MSEANHRFGFGLAKFSSGTCQSGDCADSIAAVQNLTERPWTFANTNLIGSWRALVSPIGQF
jgi:hypothetical protein